MEKKVWQGRADGCFSVAPGLVFNFRWASPSLSGGGGVSKAYSAQSEDRKRENGRGGGGGAGAINQIQAGRKCGNGDWEEKSFSPELHVLVIMSPPFLSRSCLYYLHSLFFWPNQLFQGLWRQWRPFMPSPRCPGTKWHFDFFFFFCY